MRESSIDPDQTSRYVASILSLVCLLRPNQYKYNRISHQTNLFEHVLYASGNTVNQNNISRVRAFLTRFQQRPRTACRSAQAGESLRGPPEDALDPWLPQIVPWDDSDQTALMCNLIGDFVDAML